MALKRITPGLSDTTLFTTVNRDYKDVDLSFASKPGTTFDDGIKRGDVYKKVDIRSVEQSIRNILLTNFYEKPFEPFYGANIRAMLFETMENYSERFVTERITEQVEEFEPRAKIVDIQYYEGEDLIPKGVIALSEYAKNSIYIKVEFTIENFTQSFTASVNMNRLR